jgi:hypothetical protein
MAHLQATEPDEGPGLPVLSAAEGSTDEGLRFDHPAAGLGSRASLWNFAQRSMTCYTSWPGIEDKCSPARCFCPTCEGTRALLTDERTVDVHVRRLRSKLAAIASDAQVILAKWGVGYRLAEDV